MLDGRSIIEVPSRGEHGTHTRYWLVRYHNGDFGRSVAWAVRVQDGTWYVRDGWEAIQSFPSLRDARRALFRGNGRLTGGHAEIGERGAVRGLMSPVNVMALCSGRTAPGAGDYWS